MSRPLPAQTTHRPPAIPVQCVHTITFQSLDTSDSPRSPSFASVSDSQQARHTTYPKSRLRSPPATCFVRDNEYTHSWRPRFLGRRRCLFKHAFAPARVTDTLLHFTDLSAVRPFFLCGYRYLARSNPGTAIDTSVRLTMLTHPARNTRQVPHITSPCALPAEEECDRTISVGLGA